MRKLPMTDDSSMDRLREETTGDTQRIQSEVTDETGGTAAKDDSQQKIDEAKTKTK